MTANAFAEDKKAAREAGMDGYITKPVDVDGMHTAEVCIKRQSTGLYVTTDQVLCFLMPVRRRKTYFTRSNAIRGE